jgi:hypothetical protein
MYWRAIIALLVLGWIGLYISSKAVLYSQVGPRIVPGDAQETLDCHYFTGTGTLRKRFWYAQDGILGRPACPRLQEI